VVLALGFCRWNAASAFSGWEALAWSGEESNAPPRSRHLEPVTGSRKSHRGPPKRRRPLLDLQRKLRRSLRHYRQTSHSRSLRQPPH